MSSETVYYIESLKNELARRQSRNPLYSLRAFADFLHLDPSALSRIFNRKQEISPQVCVGVVDRLKLSPEDRSLFLASVAEEKLKSLAGGLAGTFGENIMMKLPAPTRIAQSLTGFSMDKILAAVPYSVSVFDRERRLIFMNRAAQEDLPAGPNASYVGKKLSELKLSPDILKLLDDQDQWVLSRREPHTIEFMQKKLGADEWVERHVCPVFNGAKDPDGIIASSYKRKQSALALHM